MRILHQCTIKRCRDMTYAFLCNWYWICRAMNILRVNKGYLFLQKSFFSGEPAPPPTWEAPMVQTSASVPGICPPALITSFLKVGNAFMMAQYFHSQGLITIQQAADGFRLPVPQRQKHLPWQKKRLICWGNITGRSATTTSNVIWSTEKRNMKTTQKS